MADSTLHRPSLAADLPLVVGVIGTICVAFGLALYHPALAFVPIAALVAVPLLVWLFRRPLLNVAVFLGGFVLIVSHGDDFSIGEVLYGLYWLLFMVHWGVTRVIVYREPILGDVVSKALFLFLLTLLLSSPLALVFGTPFGDMVSQLRAVAMIATFFPVREAVARYDGALPLLLWVLIGTWCFVALRNLFSYQTIIANAVQSYQVGRGRVIMNDDILMSASTCLTAWVLFAKQWRQRVTLMLAFLLCFAALLLTQSRSYWVSYALTVGVLFALSPPRTRVALLIAIGMSILAFGAAAQILLGDKFTVMLAGFIQRFSSIAESGSQDISLLSRVYEAQGALSDFVFNPIIGHGPGTEFTHWNIIDHGTKTSNFIHNGYVSLLFKHGVIGFVLILTAWIGAIVAGLRAFYSRSATGITRVVGIAAGAALIGFLLSSLTAPLFTLDDTTFNVAVLMGLACGSHVRARREEAA